MNQDLLRVFETESDYDSAKDSFVYPTVSYIRDVDDVRYMPKPLLPMIDTTGYATEFVVGEYYPQEALVFKAIYDMYASQIPEDGSYYIQIENGLLNIQKNYPTEYYLTLDISQEPLWVNYLSKIMTSNELVKNFRPNESSCVINSGRAIHYEDGWFSYYD